MARVKMSMRKEARAMKGRKVVGSKSGGKSVVMRKPAPSVTGGVKKPHRFRPGTVALREIRKYQRSTDLLLRKVPFQRFVREVMQEIDNQARFSMKALIAAQQVAEAKMVDYLEDVNLACLHAKRVTVSSKDGMLVDSIYNNRVQRGYDGP